MKLIAGEKEGPGPVGMNRGLEVARFCKIGERSIAQYGSRSVAVRMRRLSARLASAGRDRLRPVRLVTPISRKAGGLATAPIVPAAPGSGVD